MQTVSFGFVKNKLVIGKVSYCPIMCNIPLKEMGKMLSYLFWLPCNKRKKNMFSYQTRESMNSSWICVSGAPLIVIWWRLPWEFLIWVRILSWFLYKYDINHDIALSATAIRPFVGYSHFYGQFHFDNSALQLKPLEWGRSESFPFPF